MAVAGPAQVVFEPLRVSSGSEDSATDDEGVDQSIRCLY